MSYNVMIVDDSRSMRKVILKTLQLSGFEIGECLEASNGQEALDILDGKWIDLILSDVHMPVMDGFGFIRIFEGEGYLQGYPGSFRYDGSKRRQAQSVDGSGRQRLHSQTVPARRDRGLAEPHHGRGRWH